MKELLKKFGLDDSKPVGTLMVTGCKLSKNDESLKVNQILYRSMFGGLLYLTQTRPDIMDVVCMATRYQDDPKESHVIAVKRIFRYLKGTMDYGLWYPKNDDFMLCAHADADWDSDVDNWKSNAGGALFVGKKLVSWASKKQDSVSLSTTEVECTVATSNCT